MKEKSSKRILKFAVLFWVGLCVAHMGAAQAFRIPEKKPIVTNAPVTDTLQTDSLQSATAAEAPPIPEIKDIKVLSEMDDGKGNFVRTIQYNKGSMRITETVIKPKSAMARVGLYVPVNPDTMDKKQVLLVVDKTNYSLKVMYKRRAIRMYRVTFGPQPKQNKCMEGDRCTPEGNFTITHLNPRSMYNKFMLISYPDASSWSRFNKLKKEGKIPASAKIGGAIGIHGIWRGGDQLIELAWAGQTAAWR